MHHQVKHLIALRQANPALHNRSGIHFVSNGAPKTALAYERFCEEEKLLVVVNPCRETVSFTYGEALGEAVYTVGGEASQDGGIITAAPVSAGVYKIG